MANRLVDMHCSPGRNAEHRLEQGPAEGWLAQLDGWVMEADGGAISRRFRFSGYDETVAFVNAVAWVARRQDHHPDILFGYRDCEIRYATHSAGGLTLNDFICAAHIDALLGK